MNNFEKTFEKLSTSLDPTRVWGEWLDYVIDINLFTTKKQDLNFHGREKQYWEMFQEWVLITNQKLQENYWYDYLGEFYESVIQTKFKAGNMGQFFTPSNVCDCMAALTIFKPSDRIINDCCCGSGRLLLASHKHDPHAICIGQDLDSVSVKMAALNFYIHGVKGSILHMNTISLEYYGGYKVNQYIDKGLPLPHIELLRSYDDAFQFFGRSWDSKVVEINNVKAGDTIQATLDSF